MIFFPTSPTKTLKTPSANPVDGTALTNWTFNNDATSCLKNTQEVPKSNTRPTRVTRDEFFGRTLSKTNPDLDAESFELSLNEESDAKTKRDLKSLLDVSTDIEDTTPLDADEDSEATQIDPIIDEESKEDVVNQAFEWTGEGDIEQILEDHMMDLDSNDQPTTGEAVDILTTMKKSALDQDVGPIKGTNKRKLDFDLPANKKQRKC